MKKRESSSSEGELGAPPPAPPTELPVEFKANKKFKEGESCRSLDQGKLYPAKVLKCGDDDAYFIHYQGWNRKWDKWVHASLLMKDGPEATKLAKQLEEQERRRKEAKESAKRSARNSSSSNNSSSEGSSRSKKPRVDYSRCLEAYDPAQPSLKIPLPFTLKKQLVEDWERCCQMDPVMLAVLPRTPSVLDLVAQYLDLKAKRSSAAQQLKLSELFDGLSLYFDAALPVTLLYANERAQFDALSAAHSGTRPSKLYGVEHLLRLFTKLPAVLGNAPMASLERSQLQAQLGEFLKHIQKNAATLFSPYEVWEKERTPPPPAQAD